MSKRTTQKIDKETEFQAEEFWGKVLQPEKTSGSTQLYGSHWGLNGFEYIAYPE